MKHTQAYDAGDRVASITLEQANGTDLQRFTYAYGFDGSGNRTAAYAFGFVTGVTELSGATVAYDYDELGRLTGATRTGTGAFAHTYGDADNRTGFTSGGTATAATYDAANQLITHGATTYDYDRNGNLVAYGANTLDYDPANKMVAGSGAGVDLGFTYDGLGRQVSRDWNANHTDFWFDWSGLTLESGSSSGSYLRDPSGVLLSAFIGTGPVRNYARDRLGSITGLTSTTQSLDRSYTYDPWGTIVASSGSAPNNFRFTGGRVDPTATGWYVLGQRHYATSLGRFTQADPLPSSITDLNRHAYAGCNPANFVDPSGTSSLPASCGAAVLDVAGLALGPALKVLNASNAAQVFGAVFGGKALGAASLGLTDGLSSPLDWLGLGLNVAGIFAATFAIFGGGAQVAFGLGVASLVVSGIQCGLSL